MQGFRVLCTLFVGGDGLHFFLMLFAWEVPTWICGWEEEPKEAHSRETTRRWRCVALWWSQGSTWTRTMCCWWGSGICRDSGGLMGQESTSPVESTGICSNLKSTPKSPIRDQFQLCHGLAKLARQHNTRLAPALLLSFSHKSNKGRANRYG